MKSNFNAWKKFWTGPRINELKKNMQISSKKSGFNPDAFTEFYSMTAKKDISWTEIPADFYSLFGISNASGKWMQF